MPKYPKGGKDNKPSGSSDSSAPSTALASGKVGRTSKKQTSGSGSQLKTTATTRLQSAASVNPDDVGIDEKDTHGDDSPDGVSLSVNEIEEDDAPSVGEQDGAADELDLDDANTVDHGQPDEEEEEDEEGGGAMALGEEERAAIPSHRMVRQASAAGEFDHRAIGNRASERFKSFVRRIEADSWDTDAWTGIVEEAQYHRGGGMSYKEVLRKCLKQFPTSGRYRRMLAQAEMESRDWQAADKVLEEGLLSCANLELWLLYLARVRRSAVAGAGRTEQEARDDTIAAFELALQHVGCNPASTPLWQEYLDFLKSWEERSPLDKGNKMTAIRKVYRRVVALPLEGLEWLWREFEEFEMAGNEMLWKTKFSLESLPKYNAARAVYKERKPVWDGINPNLLARPPSNTTSSTGGSSINNRERTKRDEVQASQYRLWKRRLAYERSNPELIDEEGLRARVRHSYAQCLSHFRHFCEFWYDFAEYEMSLGETDRAAQVYRQAIEVIPESNLLRVAQADLEERRGRLDEADRTWKAFLRDRCSTTGHIMYLRFVRRNKGKEAARKAFGATRGLRRSGKIGFRLYLAHALMELHVNGEPEVARRVLEYGLSQHEAYVSEPEYVMHYVDFLIQRNDEKNLRVLLERVLEKGTMLPDKAEPFWERFVQLEMCLARTGGSLGRVEKVEARIQEVYGDRSGKAGLAALWRRCSVAGCGRKPEGQVDTAFEGRIAPFRDDEERKGGGDRGDKIVWGDQDHDRNFGRDHADGAPWSTESNSRGGRGAGVGDGKGVGQGRGSSGSDRGKGTLGDGKKGGDDEGWSRGDSSVSPLIPPFLRKLYMSLPRHVGPQPDAEGVLKVLRERAMPDKPSNVDGNLKGKRHRNDSEDEDGGVASGMEPAPHKKPIRDLFRQRMQANLRPLDG